MASGAAAVPPFHVGDTLVVTGTAATDRGLIVFLDVHREPRGFVCYVAVYADDILLSFGRAPPSSPGAGPAPATPDVGPGPGPGGAAQQPPDAS